MALGNPDISKLEDYIDSVRGLALSLTDSNESPWNTFQFVAKNLDNWAKTTEIGESTINDVKVLSNRVWELRENTLEFVKELNRLKENQRNINRGR